MDVFNDPTFWGEVMITAASRLALVVAVIWVARLAVRSHAGPQIRARAQASAVATAAPATMAVAVGEDAAPFQHIKLHRGPERAEEAPHTESPAVDPLRQRLLEYLERRETERMPS